MRPMHVSRRLLYAAAVLLGSTALTVSACTGTVKQTASSQQAGAVKPPVALPISINAVMVAQVDHAGHILWDAGREGHAPKTDEEWEELEHHAMQLASAATLISMGGTGQADPGWVVKPDWKPLAQKLSDTAMAAVNAAHAKNLQAFLKAGDDLTDVCENCHKEFKPQLPSEGIVHPHYRH
jgi:hypothetical protein